MSQAVWRFERTVQDTVEALRDIIQRDDDVRASQVRGEWAYRAQLVLEPAGWDALWRLPRETCHNLRVRFPLVVYVTVEELDLEGSGEGEGGLLAALEVVGVQDEGVHLPARHAAVPLSQLWPMRAQPNSAMHVRPTAEFIDLYRYFYSLIWMPWDLDTDDECGWFERNVPARCSLWAAALNNSSGGPPASALRALREEATLLARRITCMEHELPSDTEDIDNTLDCSGEQMSELVMLHSRLQHVRARWEALQNPPMRKPSVEENLPPQNIVIWTGGSVDSQISCLKSVGEWLKSTRVRGAEADAIVYCSPSLSAVLESRPPRGSKLVLCPGPHHVPNDTSVGEDYTIASLNRDAVLNCLDQRTTALAITGHTVLSGLTLDVGSCSTALAVRAGNVEATSCRLISPETRSQNVQAVVVYGGTEIVLKSCMIDGFFTGVVAHSGCNVRLEDCTLTSCGVALQIYTGAKVSLVRCLFKEYEEAAIRYEINGINASEGGGSNLLHRYPDITLTECKFFSNGINEVFLARLDENACPEWEGDVAAI